MEQDGNELLHKVITEHAALASKFEAAFVRDEHGELELSEHRIFHRKQAEKEEDSIKAKQKLVNTILTWAIIGLLTIVGNGLVHAYVIPLLPLLTK